MNLRSKLRNTASTNPPSEPDGHISRQVVEQEEEMDTSGLDAIATPGQRRVEEEKRRLVHRSLNISSQSALDMSFWHTIVHIADR